MDMQDSLKKESTGSLIRDGYDPVRRIQYVDAVEMASNKMLSQLMAYIEIYEIGPEEIVIKIGRYSPNVCSSILGRELKRLGLTSKLSFSSQSSANGDTHKLFFDLDAMAEEYFSN